MNDIRINVGDETVECEGITEAGEDFVDEYPLVESVTDVGIIAIKRADMDDFIAKARVKGLFVGVEGL